MFSVIPMWCTLKYVSVALCPACFMHLLITQGEFPRCIVYVGCLSPFHSQSEVWWESSCKIQHTFFVHPSSFPMLRASEGQSLFPFFFFFFLVRSGEICQHRMCACSWEWVEVVLSCLFSSSHCHSTCGCSQLGESFSFVRAHCLFMHSHHWILQSWEVWSGKQLRDVFQPIYLYIKGRPWPKVITPV